jgi:hypothetical protein
MLRWLGNVLTVVSSLSGLLAGYLWWRAAKTDDQIAFAQISKDAALVTGISAMLIAVAESIRLVRRHRSDVREMPYYPGHKQSNDTVQASLPRSDGAQRPASPVDGNRPNRRSRGSRRNRGDRNPDQATKPADDEATH